MGMCYRKIAPATTAPISDHALIGAVDVWIRSGMGADWFSNFAAHKYGDFNITEYRTTTVISFGQV